MTPFQQALKEVLHIEGGYSNHPADRGGKTKFGITQATARRHGYRGSMRDMPVEVAERIYYKSYWKPLNLDHIAKINLNLALEMFEQGVNFGTRFPQFALQRTLNNMTIRGTLLKRDGRVGRKTLARLAAKQKKEIQKRVIVSNMNCLQGARYNELCEKRSQNKKFFEGWIDKRVRIYRAI